MEAFGRGHLAARELAAHQSEDTDGKMTSEERHLADARHKKALSRLRSEVSKGTECRHPPTPSIGVCVRPGAG
jgi:hypothetical protein